MRKEYVETNFGNLEIGDNFWSFESDRGDLNLQKTKIDADKSEWADGEGIIEVLYPEWFTVWTERETCGWYEYLVWIWITIIAIGVLALTFLTVRHFSGE